MDWDDLRLVLAVGRATRLVGAARTLGVRHSTVSRRLAALEEQLGAKLFERRPDGYVATPAGAALIESATRMEAEVLDLDRRLLGQDKRLSGTLRFTSLGLLIRTLSPDMRAFCEAYPGIELSVLATSEVASLSRREADVALRATSSPPPGLVGRRVSQVHFRVYGERSLVERIGGPDAPLSRFPWVGWDPRAQARVTHAWMRRNVPEARIAARVDSVVTLLAFVKSGIGIAFLPCLDGDAEPDLVPLLDADEDFGIQLWLLTHPDLRQTARVRAFMDHMGAALDRLRPALEGHHYAG